MKQVLIRECTHQDLESIFQLDQLWDEEGVAYVFVYGSRVDFMADFERFQKYFLVAESDGSPVDQPALRAPVYAIAVKGDTILAAMETRLAVREGGTWRVVDPPGTPIGRFTAAAADRAGFWLGGTLGLAFYQPARNVWRALTSPGDIPLPVNDVAADAEHVWVATPGGVVRLERRVLAP